jgi:hypothetical protein
MALRSRDDELAAFLRLCEKIAKGHKLPLDATRYEPEDVDRPGDFGEEAFEAYVFNKMCGDAAYYAKQAAAAWRPQFLDIIGRATSLRVRRPSAPLSKAAGEHTCMGCGRKEHRNMNVLDLGAPCVHYESAWLGGSAEPLRKTFDAFYKEYYSMGWEKEARSFEHRHLGEIHVHCCDLGSFALGSCCERKAQLFFHYSTLPLLHVFDARAEYETLGQKSARTRAEHVYATEEEVAELSGTLTSLKDCLVNDRRAVPKVPTDAAFWGEIDRTRREIKDERQQLRASLAVGWNEMGIEPSDDDEQGDRGNESDDSSFSSSSSSSSSSSRAGSRAEDADGDLHGFVVPDAPASPTRGAKRKRSMVCRSDDEEAPSAPSAPSASSAPAGPGGAAPQRLPSCFSAASYVQGQRRLDRLPARRDTVRKLYELAARLSQEQPSRMEDAALCGQAAATIAELAERAGSDM